MRGAGNRHSHAEPLAVNSFIHRKYTDLVGRYVQDIDDYIFQDTWLNDVFKMIGRKVYMHDIVIKHLHFSEGGTEDDVSKELESHRKGVWDNNQLWANTFIPLIKQEASLLKSHLNHD